MTDDPNVIWDWRSTDARQRWWTDYLAATVPLAGVGLVVFLAYAIAR